MDRSKKALKNVFTGLMNKMMIMLLAFATRTIFIRLLGAEYTGISSLYTNILSVLSLAELGVGNVLMFYLYSALKKDDEEEICKLVKEFKKIYNGIIIAVLTIGIALVPFLKFIINSELNNFDLIIYYLLYLANSVASYFVVYRTMVISADQKSYISNICSTVTTIIMYILQLIYLALFRNFLGYLIIQVSCTILNNLILNYIACKKYPYLKKKIYPKEKKDIIDKKDLFKNIKATFLYKISETILGQTDSIIISIMFGTIFVGLYSNYYMIMVYISNIAAIIANGLVASFGNLNTDNNKEKSYSMFRVSMLLFAVFGTFCTACYACIIQDFIPIWIGNEYVMGYGIVFAILAVFYLRMVTNTMWIYRSSMGLFKEVQYINIIAAILNIIFSIILGKLIGISGVIVATVFAMLVTSFWYEGKILFNKFEKNVWIYYAQQTKDFFVMILIVGISFGLSSLISISGIFAIIIKLVICTIVTIIIELIVNSRTDEFKLLKSKILNTFRK